MKVVAIAAAIVLTVAVAFIAGVAVATAGQTPLKETQRIKLPADVKGHFDHFGVDVKGNRLFATAEDTHAVLVLDLKTGEVIHRIEGLARPHAVLYREDLHRIYVTDGGEGALKIFDSESYAPVKNIKLLLDADSIAYDEKSKELYIVNGGGDAKQTFSTISIVDTTAGEKLGDMQVDGDTLEAMALEHASALMYVNNRAKNQIEVIDRAKRKIVATWPVTLGKFNVAMALDEANHRLFVGCRSGHIVVFDTRTGKELQALPIAKGVDDATFDAATGRIYASCGEGNGTVSVYKEASADQFESLGDVASGPGGRTSRLVPELGKFFVAVPSQAASASEVVVFQVQ
ncbi:MAG: YncE family protein [Candidatus Acidiferrales bacterium]